MPLFKGEGSKAKPKQAIDYVTNPKKAAIVSSLSMDDNSDYARQFKETCELYGKGSGYNERKYYHFKLSIDQADNPTPEQSHELAEKLAQELFAAHECVIATHNDTQTVHSHIIVNAVSFETGKKLHLSTKDTGKSGSYAYCKDLADTLGIEMGFTALNWREKTAQKYERTDRGEATEQKTLSSAERNMAKNGNLDTASWKEALRQAIDEAKQQATTRAEFQKYLQDVFGVTMPRNTAKTVSFVHPAVGEKYTIRGAKLGGDYTAAVIDEHLQHNKNYAAYVKYHEERGTFNNGLFVTEEQRTANPISATLSTALPATAHCSTIGSKPTGETPNREHVTPRSLSDISAELRSIDRAVQSVIRLLAKSTN